MENKWTRISSILALIAYSIYISFIVESIDRTYPVLSWLFLLFNVLSYIIFILLIINTWTAKIPRPRVAKLGMNLPRVAVIIPTWQEPTWMLRNTIASVISQRYTHSKLTIILTDDSHNSEMKSMLHELRQVHPQIEFIYHEPPQKGATNRKGEGKAGNLNSVLELLRKRDDIKYIETRDADDLIGHSSFLLHTVGQMEFDENLAFVQTTKTIPPNAKDPFGNREEFFYRSNMLYKNGANSVFSCGSGVVWRMKALIDIGGFPTWNILEDFQSGAEAVKRGWSSVYLPLIGVVSQTPPADIPNVYKQRGTWSMDSMRFLFWGDKKGLSLRQKLQFADSGIVYIFSALTYLYGFVLALWLLLGKSPIEANVFEISFYHFTWLVTFYLFMTSLAHTGNVKAFSMLRDMRNLFSLGPVHLKAFFLTLFYGPNRKPKYEVTRKIPKYGIYPMQVVPQILLVVILGIALYTHLRVNIFSLESINYGNILWAVVFIFVYSKSIFNSMHGLRLRQRKSL